MQRKIISNYGMIQGYRNYPTFDWLALSEFIDNSISSYQNKDPNSNINGLEIKIDFDFTNKDNKKIIISDNANGMGLEELLDSMQPNKTQGKKDYQYNQYGVGMKLGIFFFGENGLVYSKKKNEKEYYVNFETSNKKEWEEVIIQGFESNYNVIRNSGTKIIISKVYDKFNNITHGNKINLIKNILGSRYKYLIKDGLSIKINVKVADPKSASNANHNVEPLLIKPFDLKSWKYKKKISDKHFSLKKKSIEEEIALLENIYNEMENNSINNFKNEAVKFFNKQNQINLWDDNIDKKYYIKLKIDAYKKFINGDEIVFNKKIEFENKTTDLFFGINGMYSNQNRYSGLTTIHIKRAINHGPGDKGNENKTIQFLSTNSGSVGDSKSRRVYGEINLTGILKPDQNKRDFQWGDEKDKLQNELTRIYFTLENLLQYIVDLELRDKVSQIEKKEDIEKTAYVANEKIPSITAYYNEEKKCFGAKTNSLFEKKFQINLAGVESINFFIIESDELDKKLIDIDLKDIKNIKIIFNQNHDIWKPILNDKDTKIRSEIIYPLIVSLGMVEAIKELSQTSSKIKNNKNISEILNLVFEGN